MPDELPAAATEAQDTRVAVVLAVAAIVAAALAAWATLLAGAAGDDWQRAIRGELRVTANVVNDTITAYDQVPLAQTAIEHRFAAEELARRGAGKARATLPAVFLTWYFENGERQLTSNEAPWVRADGSFDVKGRVADMRSHENDGVLPTVSRREADANAHRAWLVGLAILPAALGFFVAATARAFPRVRRSALVSALALVFVAMALALIAGLTG